MFADFSALIKDPAAKYSDKDFWDWLDAKLLARRQKYSEIIDDQERHAKFNEYVSSTLCHISKLTSFSQALCARFD